MKASLVRVTTGSRRQMHCHLLKLLNTTFVQEALLTSGGMIVARLFGLGFSFFVAQLLTPDDFGAVYYTLAVAAIITIGVHPFGQHVLAHLVSSNLRDQEKLAEILGHAWRIFFALLILSLGVAYLCSKFSEKLGLELMAVVLGIAFFYAYWGISRGYYVPGLLTAAYLGSNVLQLLAVLIIVGWLKIREPAYAILIYGCSYIPVLIWLQWWRQLPLYLAAWRKAIRQELLRQIFALAIPIALSHAAFMLFISGDIILLKRWESPDGVGQYALAKTLATAFSFIPMAVATLLLPKIAGAENQSNRRLVLRSVTLSLLFNLFLLSVYTIFVTRFISAVFGIDYLAPLNLYLLLALASIMLGVQSILAAAHLGKNRPQIETAGRVVAAGVSICGCWFLIPAYGMIAAGWSLLGGALCALGIYGIHGLRGESW